MDTCNRLARGKLAEEAACRFLQKRGLRLLTQNYRCQYGEIDLIMQSKENEVVFVEVRSRSSTAYGTAAETIGPRKRAKIVRSALYFLQSKNWLNHINSRFDVIAIHFLQNDIQFDWIKNAFGIDETDY